MIQHSLVVPACRARALTLAVCTTGAITMARTATGYSRATGSFLTDGLRVGMEVTPGGFAADTPEVIRTLTATAMTTDTPHAAQPAAAGRTLAVGLPSRRAWENVRFVPEQEKPYVEEEYLPGTGRVRTFGTPNPMTEQFPLYLLRLFGRIEVGRDALSATVDALLAHFPPNLALTLANGDLARVRGDVVPSPSALTIDQTWAVVTVTIPLRVESRLSL